MSFCGAIEKEMSYVSNYIAIFVISVKNVSYGNENIKTGFESILSSAILT